MDVCYVIDPLLAHWITAIIAFGAGLVVGGLYARWDRTAAR